MRFNLEKGKKATINPQNNIVVLYLIWKRQQQKNSLLFSTFHEQEYKDQDVRRQVNVNFAYHEGISP